MELQKKDETLFKLGGYSEEFWRENFHRNRIEALHILTVKRHVVARVSSALVNCNGLNEHTVHTWLNTLTGRAVVHEHKGTCSSPVQVNSIILQRRLIMKISFSCHPEGDSETAKNFTISLVTQSHSSSCQVMFVYLRQFFSSLGDIQYSNLHLVYSPVLN